MSHNHDHAGADRRRAAPEAADRRSCDHGRSHCGRGNLRGLVQATNSLDDDVQADRIQQQFLNDALGSAAVIVAAIVVATTGWTRADAIVLLLIGALILPTTWILLRDSGRVLLEATPAGLDLDAVRQHILEVPHVRDVHDLHASQIATGLPTLSAHLVLDEECFYDGHVPALLDRLQGCVAEHFPISIEHSTFQFEQSSHLAHEATRHH